MHSSFCTDSIKNVKTGATPFTNSQANGGTPDDGCKLVLGLGPTSCANSDVYRYPLCGRNKGKGTAHIINDQGLLSQHDSTLKLWPTGPANAVSDHISGGYSTFSIPVVDEGSTSAKKSGGYMTGLLLAPSRENNNILLVNNFSEPQCQVSQLGSEPSGVSSFSPSSITEPGSVSVSSDQKSSSMKRCNFVGCTKGARGSTSLCIGHGGGQRCRKPGCNRGAESRAAYCKAHGGGKRCEHLGCTKSAEGKTEHCIAHGGGRRCEHSGGCTKAARGKTGLCIKHGGGKRCKVEGCIRSAEGQIGLCISHGGGRRCSSVGCTKGAQGSTLFCKAHGGGKRCIFGGCNKGAEGSTPLCKGHGGGKRCMFDGGGICPKSVHGGTNFCVAHGGGKRCAVPGCTRSARGKTDCCVRHGGGKRCKYENCGKSAQGSTDFCKAHGGGKRCCYGDGQCGKFARGKSGFCAAHANLVQGRDMQLGGMIDPGLFMGLVPCGTSIDNNSSGLSAISSSDKQQLIPEEVLVPASMKGLCGGSEVQGESSTGKGIDFAVPEGRVHGGRLLALLGGNLDNASVVNFGG